MKNRKKLPKSYYLAVFTRQLTGKLTDYESDQSSVLIAQNTTKSTFNVTETTIGLSVS